MGGWHGLSEQVNEVMTPNDPLTALVVNLTGVDPDDAFSRVPYEKGSTFLWYLEDTGKIQSLCSSLKNSFPNSNRIVHR